MRGLEHFADTTALEALLHRLAVRHLTLEPDRRQSALDRCFARWCERPSGEPRFLVPSNLTDGIGFDVGNSADPIATYADVEQDFVVALNEVMLTPPSIDTPKSHAEANADRERLAQLEVLLRDHPDAGAIEGVLRFDTEGQRAWTQPAFVVFDRELYQRTLGEYTRIAERERTRQDQRAAQRKGERDLHVPDVHRDGALAAASLRAATRLNALHRAELEPDPQNLTALAARWNRIFKDGPISGSITESRLSEYANRVEWRLARRLRGAARAELQTAIDGKSVAERFAAWQRNVDERRAQLRERERALAPGDPARAQIDAERTALDNEVLAGNRARVKLDAFDRMVERANDARAENRNFARTQRTLDILSDRISEQKRQAGGAADLRSTIDRTHNIQQRLVARREELDGAEIPAYQHYVLEAYYREALSSLYDGREQVDTLAVDAATVSIACDFAEIAHAKRPIGERTVIDILRKPADEGARARFDEALKLGVSLDALAALAEHPEQINQFASGLRAQVETLVAAYRFGNAAMLRALERHSPQSPLANAEGPKFFANARLSALSHAPVDLDANKRAAARRESAIMPPPATVRLLVPRSDLVEALAGDPDIQACFTPQLTAARLAQVLSANVDARARALAQDPALARPLAILQAKALATVAQAEGGKRAFRVPAALSQHVPKLASEILPPALRDGGPSDLQRRIGILPVDGEGELVTRAQGHVVSMMALVSTPDGERVFTQRITPDSNIVVPPNAKSLAEVELRDGLEPLRPIGGLLAVVEAPNGDRVVVPIHGIASARMGDAAPTERFAFDPTKALIEAMVDGRPVALESAHTRSGMSLQIDAVRQVVQHQALEEHVGEEPAIDIDLATMQPFIQHATRKDVPRPRAALLRIEGAADGGFVYARESTAVPGSSSIHRVPEHALPDDARESLNNGQTYNGIFAIEPQLFSNSLRYQTVVDSREDRAHERLLQIQLRDALGLGEETPLHIIPVDVRDGIPESARAHLVMRTPAFGYYFLDVADEAHQPRATVVEYTPHAQAMTRLARFNSDGDRDGMDEEATQTKSHEQRLHRTEQSEIEPMALPTMGTFSTANGDWKILPAADASEGLRFVPLTRVNIVSLEDVSFARADNRVHREREVNARKVGAMAQPDPQGATRPFAKEWDVPVLDQDHTDVTVPGRRGPTTVARTAIARMHPDDREWSVKRHDKEFLFIEDPHDVGRNTVVAIPTSEIQDDLANERLSPGTRLTIGRTFGEQVSVNVRTVAREGQVLSR